MIFMKRSFLTAAILTAIFACTSRSAQAQVDLTVNPIGILFGDFSFGADFALADQFSIEAAIGFGSNAILDVKGNNVPVTAIGKYYFSPKNGADGFYADVFARYVYRQWNYTDNSGFADFTTNRFGLGFGAGYKVVSKGGFVFDVGLGAGRAILDKNVYSDSSGNREDLNWPDLMFQGKLAIGYRFGKK
jgi:hypothetical protein